MLFAEPLTLLCLMNVFLLCSFEEFCTKESCEDIVYNGDLHVLTFGPEKHASVFLPDILKAQKHEYIPFKDGIKLIWPRYGAVEVSKQTIGEVGCHVASWGIFSKDFEPHDCISLKGSYWYGGAELHHQRWPLENNLRLQPFASEDVVIKKESFGNVLEPFWISSAGVGILVDDSVPLFVSFNNSGSQQMCFNAKFDGIYRESGGSGHPTLKYTVCKGKNVRSVFQTLRTNIFDLPENMPDLRMIKSPIWSTWAKYKVNINQQKVLEYADLINRYGFSNNQLEIDDMFSTKYGDFDFDPFKFSNPKEMINQLKSKGFRTTVWVTPFANLDSKAFIEGMERRYFLTDKTSSVPALVEWWQGIGAVFDPTNKNASKWYLKRLDTMKTNYGVDSFKFDAGETNFLPIPLYSHQWMMSPNGFTTKYVNIISNQGNMIEVRCGYKTQKHAIFVRMADKESRWGYDNGIKTIIPTVLTFGILGYPYVLPDMIGGNGYGEVLAQDVVLPDRELYIRWLQLTAYLPSMQFSFAPWDYDKEVVDIALEMVKIHETVVTPIIIAAADDSIRYGYPIIRPMWWIDPNDQDTFTIDTQFMVGDNLMVAPILDAGARQRDVYLPVGTWRDNLNGEDIDGGRWLKDYPISLNQIATFNRQ